MEDQNNDDMDSLFEGMVLFPPQTADKDDVSSPSDALPPVSDGSLAAVASVAPLSSEPLDENLFSDLTVITPSHAEASDTKMQIPSDPSPVTSLKTAQTTLEAPVVSIFRQSSRKKKRAGLRIGYGRDSQLGDEPEPNSDPPESISVAESQSELDAKGNIGQEVSLISSHGRQSDQVDSCPTQPGNEHFDGGSIDMVESHFKQVSHELDLAEDRNAVSLSVEAGAEELRRTQKQDTVEGEYEQIKAQISHKMRQIQEHTSSLSLEKKDSRRRRRKASENVELAYVSYIEIEKKLEEACETEDFEMADRLSENLAAAEKEKEHLLNVLRDAEAQCDAIDSKIEKALENQIIVEEECASLLRRFSMDTLSNADMVFETVEAKFSKETDQWFMSAEAIEAKKLEIEIESQLVNDVRASLNCSVDHLVDDDVKEKEVLCEKKKLLAQELEELLRLVQEKEAEIAENDSKIEAVDRKIAAAVSGFEDVQTEVDASFQKLQSILSQVESKSEALSTKKQEIDDLLSQGKSRVEELKKLAMISASEANTYEENLRLRKAIIISVLKAREEKLRLAKMEEKVLADIQMLKQEISVARASLQELSSKKSSIQQEGATLKQRMLFIDKRVPELEAEKKVAATARNFKEAARIASEAKSLTAEKETQQAKLEESMLELGKIDEQIKELTGKLQEFEELVSSKEKEAAVARFQRLRLISAAASNERSAALELGDLEEANILFAEVEAADSESKQLQLVHNISEEEFGSLFERLIPMELLSSLDAKQLEELAATCNQSPS